MCVDSRSLKHALTATSSFTSVGLAALAITRMDHNLMVLARREYSSALNLLARAIRDPKEYASAPMLAASFNLSVFEMLACDAPSAANMWLKHIKGTIVLLHCLYLASGGAINDINGVVQVSYTAALACLISGQAVPKFLIDLMHSCGRVAGGTALLPVVQLFTLLSSLISLYNRTKQGHGSGSFHFASAAIGLDQKLLEWVGEDPRRFIRTGDSLQADEYIWLARTQSYYRICRLLAHRIVLDNLDMLSHSIHANSSTLITEPSVQYNRSSSTLLQVSREIFANIPSMLGNADQPTLAVSSDLFFLITILQPVSMLTDKHTVINSWASKVDPLFVGRADLAQEVVLRHLRWSTP
ncbi:hypothetical protein BBP40_005384 [Aspergillus hancockii]|nr:hypothetical protein BBP40_005384 [Aspergillus hancockii]